MMAVGAPPRISVIPMATPTLPEPFGYLLLFQMSRKISHSPFFCRL